MKIIANQLGRLSGVARIGAIAGAMFLATTSLHAQLTPPAASPPANTESSSISHKAKEFLKDAGQIDQTEIAAANVALAKTENTQVKDLASMMVNDHSKNYQELQRVAAASGVTLSPTLSWENKHEVNKLQKDSGADFDKDFDKAMLKGHVKAIKKFEKAAAEIKDPEVRQYAETTLPTLRNHLQHAEQLANAVGIDPSTVKSILRDLPNEDRAVSVR